jgi:F-type H+-transporting ATPase subunit b
VGKPAAKKGLIAVLVVYVIIILTMVTGLVVRGKPQNEAEVTAHVQQALNQVRAEAYDADPEHIRAQDLSQSDAAAVFASQIRARGSIISINYTLIMQCLNFAILLLLLYGWLWEPMLKMLDKRKEMVKARMDDAEEDRKKAADLLEQRGRELGELRSERTSILEQAEGLGEQERREIVARARQEAQRIMEQTEERLSEETRRAREALRDEVADLATKIAAEVLKREISAEDHRRIMQDMMNAMSATAAPDAEGGKS